MYFRFMTQKTNLRTYVTTLIFTLSQGMVFNTKCSAPSISREKKSTIGFPTDINIEYSGRQVTFITLAFFSTSDFAHPDT